MQARALLLALAACGDNLPATEVTTYATHAVEVAGHAMLVPDGFALTVTRTVPGVRFFSRPDGAYTSVPGDLATVNGRVVEGTADVEHDLQLPHGLATADGWLYIAEHARVSRVRIGDAFATPEVVIDNLPSLASVGEYAHPYKNLLVDGDDLYVSIPSSTNADPADQLADPVRGAIYKYPLGGGAPTLIAKGIRNAEGLAIDPITGELWATINHRDNIGYPLEDGALPYGAVDQTYVNDHPREPFTRIVAGGNYGWPYCFFDSGTYLPDPENNPHGSVVDCSTMTPPDNTLPAHAAPLGFSFWTNGPGKLENAAVIATHGCWDCTVVHGYELLILVRRADNTFEDPVPLVTGWYPDPDGNPYAGSEAWGRPVDVMPNADGLQITDDLGGLVYQLAPSTN